MCPSAPNGHSGTLIDPDLEYAVHNGVCLTGTLYRPENSVPAGILVAVHGGGWKSGSGSSYEHWGHWLSRHGFALFAIEYRVATKPETRFPACLVDVLAAIRFIHASAKLYDLDPDRIALIGDSAGAHLVSLAALTRNSTQSKDGLYQPAIRAVVSVYGVYDLFAQWEHDQICRPRDQITEGLMGFSPLEDKLAYFQASPVAYTTTKAPRTAFMIVWGADDDVVDCTSQSQRFMRELKQSGQFVRPVPIVGAPHFWIDQPIDEVGSFTGFLAPKLLRFLDEKL